MMNICAVDGLRSALLLSIHWARLSIFLRADASHFGSPHISAPTLGKHFTGYPRSKFKIAVVVTMVKWLTTDMY